MKTQPPLNVPTFSLAERDRRWSIANQLMDEAELDALIIYGDREGASPAPFCPDTYFTNDRPGSIVLFPRGQEPIAFVIIPTVIGDHIQAGYVKKSGWLKSENIYVGKMGAKVVEVIEDRGMQNCKFGVIGLEAYPPFNFDGAMPYNTWQTILEEFPKAAFEAVGSRFFELTAAKSEEELAVIKWSASTGEKMCQAMLDATKPGVRESEIYAAAMKVCAENACFASEILLGSGPEHVGWGAPAWLYRPEEPRIIQEGDIILAEVFSSFGMLETQHQLAIAVGAVHPDFEKAADVARKSYESGVKVLKAGTTFGDVVEAMKAPMHEVKNCWHVHPLIHSICPFGLIGVGDRMLDLPEAKNYGSKVLMIPSMGLETVLKAGMVFAFEPNCAIGKKVVNLGGTVIVGEDGGIELNSLSTRLTRAKW